MEKTVKVRQKYFKATKPYIVFLPWDRHGRILIAAGLTYFGVGLTYVLSDPSVTREEALKVALRWFPIETWGYIIAAIGILTIVSSRWPPVTKRWGYVLLTGFAAGWASTYVAGVIAGAPLQNLSGAFLWGNFAYLWYIISGLPERSESKLEETPRTAGEETIGRDRNC